ncbi:amidohydrolase family protein [Mycobacterium haemophilum]
MSFTRSVVTGGSVLIGDPLTAEFRRADILIEDGRIAAIEKDLSGLDAKTIDATNRWVIPGFVDSHRHLWQTTMRGVTANWNLTDYYWCIRSHFAGLHDTDDVYAGQYAGGLDALAAGVTTTLDFCHITNWPEHSDAAVQGIKDSGIRALWCYGFYPSPQQSPSFTKPDDRFADARRVRESHFSSDHGLIRMGAALTEVGLQPFTETIREIDTANDLDVPVTMHTQCIWARPKINDVQLYARAGLLREGQIHAHSNTCDHHDLSLLRDAGCSVTTAPDTELQMAMGYPIFGRATRLGLTAGIGIDIVSNNSGDLFTSMRILLQHERGAALQPVLEESGLGAIAELPVSTRQILRAATLLGAKALGLESVCGSIEVGKAADLVLLRNDRLHLRPIIDPVDSIVMQATTRDIDRVLVDGRTVVQDGALPAAVERRGTELIDAANNRLAQRVAPLGGWKLTVPPNFVDSAVAAFEAANAENDRASRRM